VALHQRAEKITATGDRGVVYISRAFSRLPVFLEMVAGFKCPRDLVIVMKGPAVEKELESVAPHLHRWKMSLRNVEVFTLPGTHHRRTILVFQ
jgi:16S rRNA G527 N7-methylase RsmG